MAKRSEAPKPAEVSPYRNRIVRTGVLRAGEILANPKNWRVHPFAQRNAMTAALSRVGWVAGVTVNLRTGEAWGRDRNAETLIDGHLRGDIALAIGEDAEVPVTYVDLEPDEEALALASFDPLGAMAVEDRAKLAELMEDARKLTVSTEDASTFEELWATTAARARLDAGKAKPAADDMGAEAIEKGEQIGKVAAVNVTVHASDKREIEDRLRVVAGREGCSQGEALLWLLREDGKRAKEPA